MKKVLNILLIASVITLGSNFAVAKKTQATDENMLAAKKEKEIQIIEPEKEVRLIKKKK